MLDEELYLSADPQLMKERENARRLTRLYNQTTEKEEELRINLLKELFGSTGHALYIEPTFRCTTVLTFMLEKIFMLILTAYF
jgi:maltose O-acetyltransferase